MSSEVLTVTDVAGALGCKVERVKNILRKNPSIRPCGRAAHIRLFNTAAVLRVAEIMAAQRPNAARTAQPV